MSKVINKETPCELCGFSTVEGDMVEVGYGDMYICMACVTEIQNAETVKISALQHLNDADPGTVAPKSVGDFLLERATFKK